MSLYAPAISHRAARCSGLRNSLAAALLAACGAAHATPIGAGEQVIYNVDMTGLSPAPVYDAVSLLPSVGSIDGADVASFTVFGGANAQGAVLLTFGISDTPFIETLAGVLDGVFSVVFSVTQGEVDIDTLGVIGFQSIGPNEFIETPRLPVRAVLFDDDDPVGTVAEPASLGLAGAAVLAGLLTRRRRGNGDHKATPPAPV